MNKKIYRLSKSCIGDLEKKNVMQVLDHEFLGMGEEVKKFEHTLQNYLGREVASAVNGTAALQLALQACGIGHGDEVLVPTLTYVASFQAISATGAIPVACDVDFKSLTLSVEDAKKRVTKNTKAVMPVHYSGGVGNLNEIYKFASNLGLRVIEDAAHAFGTIYQEKRVGSFGDVVCFSFDGIKNLTSGEGGCIATSDTRVIEKIKDIRLLGVHKDTDMRFSGKRSWEFDVFEQGWRYHMSNVMAAIGNAQMDKFSEMAARRQKIGMLYNKYLANNSKLEVMDHDYELVVPHIYVIRLKEGIEKVVIQQKLMDVGIQTGVHYQPAHTLSFYSNKISLPFPNAEKAYSEILTLPMHPDLSDQDIDFIAKSLLKIIT